MFDLTGLNPGLETLPMLTNARTRSLCAENPTGAKGGRGPGRPRRQNPGEQPGRRAGRCAPASPSSPAAARPRRWPTSPAPASSSTSGSPSRETAYRDCILRMYWDGEETPSVEVPAGRLLLQRPRPARQRQLAAHRRQPLRRLQLLLADALPQAAPASPSRTSAGEDIGGFFYQITYAADRRARRRRATSTPSGAAPTTTPRVSRARRSSTASQGKGQYVGTYLAWTQLSNGWWGEGEIKFYMDGDGEFPTICGTGTEDYFGGAWGFGDDLLRPLPGLPAVAARARGRVPKHGLYRWHIMDPIRFEQDLQGDHAGAGLVAERQVPAADRRHRLASATGTRPSRTPPSPSCPPGEPASTAPEADARCPESGTGNRKRRTGSWGLGTVGAPEAPRRSPNAPHGASPVTARGTLAVAPLHGAPLLPWPGAVATCGYFSALSVLVLGLGLSAFGVSAGASAAGLACWAPCL